MKSARMTRTIRSMAALALFAFGAATSAAAQTSSLVSVQPLDFGQLLPGFVESVTVQDAWRRAEVRLEGTGTFDVRLVLPAELVSREGARLPLVFRNGDGAVLYKNGRVTPFDPALPQRITVPPGHGHAGIVVGGTATVAPGQAAGVYTATVVVVVSPTDS